MTTVFDTVQAPGETFIMGTTVYVRYVGALDPEDEITIQGRRSIPITATGYWSIDLEPSPASSYYEFTTTVPGRQAVTTVRKGVVPVSVDPVWLGEIDPDPPVGQPTLHTEDLVGAHSAAAIALAPVARVNATTVQAAIAVIAEDRPLSMLAYADGSAATMQSAAMQDALTDASTQGRPVLFPPGFRIRAAQNLYGWGALEIIGSPGSELILDGNLALDDGVKYWLNLGITAKNTAPSPWTGRISGLTLVATANANVERMINVHSGLDYLFDRVVVDLTAVGDMGASGFAGYNDGAWCTNPTRGGAHFSGCRVRAAAGANGGEGLGHGSCDGLWIDDLDVYGVGDDMLGIHWCNDVHASRLRLRGTDGRLLISNSSDVFISDYLVERIAKPDATFVGGGALLETILEYTGGSAPRRIQLRGGQLVLPNGVPSATYMARIAGIRNSIIDGLLLRCDTTNVVEGIRLEASTLAGWSDPEGIDLDTTARIRNLGIRDVRSVGSVDVGIREAGVPSTLFPGPIDIDNCTVEGYRFYGAKDHFGASNRVKDGNPEKLFEVLGTAFIDAVPLLVGAATAVPNGGSAFVLIGASVSRFYPGRKGIITGYQMIASADASAGIFGRLYKNGAFDEADDQTLASGRSLVGGYYQAVKTRFDEDDYIQFQIINSEAAPVDVYVRLIGVYTT